MPSESGAAHAVEQLRPPAGYASRPPRRPAGPRPKAIDDCTVNKGHNRCNIHCKLQRRNLRKRSKWVQSRNCNICKSQTITAPVMRILSADRCSWLILVFSLIDFCYQFLPRRLPRWIHTGFFITEITVRFGLKNTRFAYFLFICATHLFLSKRIAARTSAGSTSYHLAVRATPFVAACSASAHVGVPLGRVIGPRQKLRVSTSIRLVW